MSTHSSRMLRHISSSTTSPMCTVQAVSKAASACVGRHAGVPHALGVQHHSTQTTAHGLSAAKHHPSLTLTVYQQTSHTSTSTPLWSAVGTRREFSVAAAARSAKLVDDHDDDLVDSDVDSDEEEDDIVETLRKDGDDGVKDDKLSVTWPPGTPPPGRKQRLGEMWAQMEHHGRGTRKVKVKFFHDLLRRVEKEEDVKYAKSALKLFKKQGSPIERPTVTLYIKTCCRAGAPLEALAAVDDLPRDKVSPHTFKFLLLELYLRGHTKELVRAVKKAKGQRRRECKGMYHAHDLLLRRQGQTVPLMKARAQAKAGELTESEEAAAAGDDASVSSEGTALENATGREAAVEEGSSEEEGKEESTTR